MCYLVCPICHAIWSCDDKTEVKPYILTYDLAMIRLCRSPTDFELPRSGLAETVSDEQVGTWLSEM